jgi:Zn-dependent oligopeptidase
MAARLAADEGDDDLQLWDWRYYDTQLRRTEYGVDMHAVAAYFPLQQVLDGLLEITAEVFGLEYRPLTGVPVWHPDVRSYTIVDRATGEAVAVAHMDLHPREGKFSHAAAFDLVPGRRLVDGTYRTPVSAIVANFTKPTAGRPSLLLHDEVVTLFHEFGHVLHQTLTRAATARFSGTNTERDFVEAPSQIMEHWCWRPEVLTRFARHHETGEPIPTELVDQLVAARDLNVGVVNLRQAQFGILDMGFHGPRRPEDGTTADGGRDLAAILRRAEAVALFDHVEGTFMPANFGHLLGGYDAGYYGYLWSKVYGDDMFSTFLAAGVTDPAVGRSYRAAILEKGGSVPATEMLEDFLGRAPNNEAFLAGLGIW